MFSSFLCIKTPCLTPDSAKSRHGPVPDELTPDPQHWFTEDHLSTVLSCLNRRLGPEDYSELPPLPLWKHGSWSVQNKNYSLQTIPYLTEKERKLLEEALAFAPPPAIGSPSIPFSILLCVAVGGPNERQQKMLGPLLICSLYANFSPYFVHCGTGYQKANSACANTITNSKAKMISNAIVQNATFFNYVVNKLYEV